MASSHALKVRNLFDGAIPQISPAFTVSTIAECADDANGVAAQLINVCHVRRAVRVYTWIPNVRLKPDAVVVRVGLASCCRADKQAAVFKARAIVAGNVHLLSVEFPRCRDQLLHGDVQWLVCNSGCHGSRKESEAIGEARHTPNEKEISESLPRARLIWVADV